MYEECNLFDQLKACTKCGDTLPFTIEFFYAESRNNSGLSGKCRECFKARTREWLAENREYASARTRRYREENHEHVLELEKLGRERNREAKLKRDRLYYQRNREAALESMRAYYQAHREEIAAQVRKWTSENLDKVNQQSAKKRARKLQATVGVVCYERLLEIHGMVCHICGGDIESRADLHMDHVIPLSKGGAHSMDNIRPSHAVCNMHKGARL